VCEPSGEARQNGDIFIAVAAAIGTALKPVKESDVKKAAKVKAKIAFHPFKKDTGHDIDAETFAEATTGSIVQGSRLLWLKHVETASVTA